MFLPENKISKLMMSYELVKVFIALAETWCLFNLASVGCVQLLISIHKNPVICFGARD